MLLCAYEMKEFMKVTSETLFTTSTRYEAENGSNGSCNFVFNSGPQLCNGPSKFDTLNPKYETLINWTFVTSFI